jgi:putative NIF3 family GTP cyclohydrolase 1 type 2
MNASDIAQKIKSGFGSRWSESKADGFQIGNSDTAIMGVAVAWTPTIEVLERAVAENKNFILTKEGPFWQDAAPRPEQVVSGASPIAIIEKTDLYRYKREYIEKNGLVLWRVSRNWSSPEKNFALEGLASALGWERYAQNAKSDSLASIGAALYSIPPISFDTLMKSLKQRLNAPAARALGDPKSVIKNVVVEPGFLSKPDMMTVAAAKPDAILCGEGCEWEAFEYAEDWITAGWGKAMIMTGLAVSQDTAAKQIAAWLESLHLAVPVSYFATGSPFTAVVGDHA